MIDFKSIKVIVFDFDGTLADSNPVKRGAWRQIFADRPKAHDEILQKNVDAEIGDRFKILSATFDSLGEEASRIPEMVNKYANKYSELVQSGIMQAGLFPGVRELLPILKSGHRLYVNSATPLKALRDIAKKLAVTDYFEEFFGSESSKADNLRKIMKRENVLPVEVLMVGDGKDDLAGAEELNCFFVGIANEYNNWSNGNIGYSVIKNISELKTLFV